MRHSRRKLKSSLSEFLGLATLRKLIGELPPTLIGLSETTKALPVVYGVLDLAVEVVDDVERLLSREESGEPREEHGRGAVGARGELERDDRVGEVVVLLRVAHRRVHLQHKSIP